MKKEEKSGNLLRETARDILALGSIPFFLLVIVRVMMLEKPYFPGQFIIAGVIFFILFAIFKSDIYSGLGLIMLTFTILFYRDLQFSILAVIIYVLLITSLFYLGKERNMILKGVFFGAISTAISWWLTGIIF